MALYEYQRIDLEGPSIRLLRLFKGSFEHDIHCELFDAYSGLPNDHMPYEALSYTWGSSDKEVEILVNGQLMQITSNLSAALRQIRYRDQDRILWIDAICINQNNNDERQYQVQQMDLIYKGAEEVLVWLGPSSKAVDKTMDFMKQLLEYIETKFKSMATGET